VTLTDNAPNGNPAKQLIPLAGVCELDIQTIEWIKSPHRT
jgi:hypothetical protein